jgi:hypothetical protein
MGRERPGRHVYCADDLDAHRGLPEKKTPAGDHRGFRGRTISKGGSIARDSKQHGGATVHSRISAFHNF